MMSQATRSRRVGELLPTGSGRCRAHSTDRLTEVAPTRRETTGWQAQNRGEVMLNEAEVAVGSGQPQLVSSPRSVPVVLRIDGVSKYSSTPDSQGRYAIGEPLSDLGPAEEISIEDKLRRVLEQLADIRLAVLFGSAARGAAGSRSDLDIGVSFRQRDETETPAQSAYPARAGDRPGGRPGLAPRSPAASPFRDRPRGSCACATRPPRLGRLPRPGDDRLVGLGTDGTNRASNGGQKARSGGRTWFRLRSSPPRSAVHVCA